mgnify:CR=1 FL=1
MSLYQNLYTQFEFLNILRLHLSECFYFFQEMIDEADRDGDGEVSQDEFLRIMKKTSLY